MQLDEVNGIGKIDLVAIKLKGLFLQEAYANLRLLLLLP